MLELPRKACEDLLAAPLEVDNLSMDRTTILEHLSATRRHVTTG
jgi:hypothetical protein